MFPAPTAQIKWRLKDADMIALATERRDIMELAPREFIPAESGYLPMVAHIELWSWEEAKSLWLSRLHSCARERAA